jgi:hypothetical protein
MTTKADSPGERRWRWAVRIAGLCAFTLCGVQYTLRGEVDLAFLLAAAGAMGLDSIQGLEIRRRNGGGK